MLVQLEGHGREDLGGGLDLSRSVGWFTSLFPLRLAPAADLGASIKAIKEQLRGVPDKGVGYGLLRYLAGAESAQALAALPQPRITFNYLGQFDRQFDENALLVPATESAGQAQDPRAPLANWLSIEGQVYGGELKPVSIQIEHKDVWLASQNEWFYSSILDLSLNGDVQKVLLRDMQRHPFKQIVLHLDFQRVNENEAIHIRVPLHFLNQEKSPAGKKAGIVVTHELNDVEISCLPRDLPEYIEVDLGSIDVGDIVHLSDLKLPDGVEIPELRFGKEHDVAVAIAKEMKEEVEVAPAAAEGEAAAAAPAAGAAAAPAKKDDKK